MNSTKVSNRNRVSEVCHSPESQRGRLRSIVPDRGFRVRRRSRSRSPWVNVESPRRTSTGHGAGGTPMNSSRKKSGSVERVKMSQKHMCPLYDHASRILRAWSEDRRRSKRDISFDPQLRECRAIEQYCDVAVKSTEVNVDKGQVYPYVEQA